MILETLSITDFRVFQGRHIFDLNPRYKWNQKQPIILFGGLNGAGKTSILTAVRVALYGRQALGHGTTIKAYEEFLANSIHRSRDSVLQAKFVCIELTFSYAHMGMQSHYRVKRHWALNGKKVKETLSIFQDDKKLDNLSYEQCQGFLNELVPIGVSDLFFFDGEKIAELAEDTTGAALSDAIKKLLGLDLIEQLNADLSILLRNHGKASLKQEKRVEIENLEKELATHEKASNEEINAYSEMRNNWVEASKYLDKLHNDLNQKGGAWAASREEELSKSAELNTRKTFLENDIRELLSESFPFSLGKQFIEKTLFQLEHEKGLKIHNQSIEILSKYNKKLQQKLSKELKKDIYQKVEKIIGENMDGLISKSIDDKPIHDISDTQYSRISHILRHKLNNDVEKITHYAKELTLINEELDNLGKNIARAPDELSLANKFKEIKQHQEHVTKIQAKMEMHRENAKQILRQAMDTTRKLDKLHKLSTESDDNAHAYKHIYTAKNFLNDFNKKVAKQKIQDLEQEFIKTFKRLARKDDISIKASINPIDFKVTLINDANEMVNKDELSAGEKQIYAISILEALARTSGRKLPIIIDTPLGRLDSKHRMNLVENYFPCASQQVIILSTDTEVDEEFYRSLYKSISHAYQLDYDTASGSTFAKEGYFWRNSEAA